MALPWLITGGSLAIRQSQIKAVPGPDRLVLNETEKTIGIKAVRMIEKFLQRRPYSQPEKTVIICRAERLSLPAQQALLKTLEEPPANSQIILLAESENQLLPTVVSRCLVTRLPTAEISAEEFKTQAEIHRRLSQAALAAKFKLIAAAAVNQETAINFVTAQLHFCRRQLISQPEQIKPKLIRALNRALIALRANVNPKLTLEVLSLNY